MSVHVTGVGCLSALGADMVACKAGLFASEGRLPAAPQRFSTGHPRTYPVFELPAEVISALPLGGEAGQTLLTARMAWGAAAEAMNSSALQQRLQDAAGPVRIGVCVGTTVGSAMNDETFYRSYRSPDGGEPDMAAIRRYLGSNPAEVIARQLESLLEGRVEIALVQTVCNACSSGADAIGIASGWLQGGLCDVALAGGADELCRVTLNGFASLMIHDQRHCRPFDVERAGLNLGEGAAMLVLEREEDMHILGGESRGRILGYGARCDAHHLTAPHPAGRGLQGALEDALGRAGLEPGHMAFVNAHGTGTRDNDRVESLVMATELQGVPFFSSKGRTGHTLGAAGAIEAAFTLACLEEGAIPASFRCRTPDPELPAQPVLQPLEISGDSALSFSLAFGGSNAVLVLGKAGR